MHWKDISCWEPGERRDQPNRMSIEGPGLRVTIWRRGEHWHLFTHGALSDWVVLEEQDIKAVQFEALAHVQEQLERMLSTCHQMKGASQ